MSAAATQPATPSRNAFSAVFACRRQVDGMEDDTTWRLFLGQVTGKTSLREMTPEEVRRVVDKLQAAGAKRLVPQSGKGADTRPQAAKLRRLWLSLWELGAVRDRSDAALASFVMGQTGIEAMRWNNARDLNLAIEALKSWCARLGYRPKPATNLPVRAAMHGRFEPALILAQWERLMSIGAVNHPGASANGWTRNQFGKDLLDLDASQACEAIRKLGQWLRRAARGQPELEEGADG